LVNDSSIIEEKETTNFVVEVFAKLIHRHVGL